MAQMLIEPFLRFYKTFANNNDFGKIDLKNYDTLFTIGVTRQFLKYSSTVDLKLAVPDKDRSESDLWINTYEGYREIIVWENSEMEKQLYIMGERAGGRLVKKDIWWTPSPDQPVRKHSSGVFDSVVIDEIPLNSTLIDQHELTNLGTYPYLNERLYLCSEVQRNVDPIKDLTFDKQIPKYYNVAIEILATGSTSEEKERILAEYFQ